MLRAVLGLSLVLLSVATAAAAPGQIHITQNTRPELCKAVYHLLRLPQNAAYLPALPVCISAKHKNTESCNRSYYKSDSAIPIDLFIPPDSADFSQPVWKPMSADDARRVVPNSYATGVQFYGAGTVTVDETTIALAGFEGIPKSLAQAEEKLYRVKYTNVVHGYAVTNPFLRMDERGTSVSAKAFNRQAAPQGILYYKKELFLIEHQPPLFWLAKPGFAYDGIPIGLHLVCSFRVEDLN